MPEIIKFNCPSCGQTLKVGTDKIGRKAKCIKCGTSMIIPAAAAPPPQEIAKKTSGAPIPPRVSSPKDEEEIEEFEGTIVDDDIIEVTPVEEVNPSRSRRRPSSHDDDDEEDRDFRRRRNSRGRLARDDDDEDYDDRPVRRPGASKKGKWKKVRVGVLLVFIGACVLAGGFVLEQIPQLVYSTGAVRSLDTMRMLNLIGELAAVLVLAAQVVAVVGYPFCLFVPNKHASLGLAIASLALGAINLLLQLIILNDRFSPNNVAFQFYGTLRFGWGMGLLVQLLIYAELIVFPLFIRAVGLTLRDSGLADFAMKVVILAGVTTGIFVFREILTRVVFEGALGQLSQFLVYLLSGLYWIGVLVYLIQVAFYAVVLKQAHSAIEYET